MKTIYKYDLSIIAKQQVQLSSSAKILSAGSIKGRISIWAEVDPDDKVFTGRTIYIFPTGYKVPGFMDLEFIDTVIITEIAEVYHIYQEKD